MYDIYVFLQEPPSLSASRNYTKIAEYLWIGF